MASSTLGCPTVRLLLYPLSLAVPVSLLPPSPLHQVLRLSLARPPPLAASIPPRSLSVSCCCLCRPATAQTAPAPRSPSPLRTAAERGDRSCSVTVWAAVDAAFRRTAVVVSSVWLASCPPRAQPSHNPQQRSSIARGALRALDWRALCCLLRLSAGDRRLHRTALRQPLHRCGLPPGCILLSC